MDVLKEIDHGALVTAEGSGTAPGRQEQAGNEHLESHFLSPEIREWGGNARQGMTVRIEAGPLGVPWDLAGATGSDWSMLKGR